MDLDAALCAKVRSAVAEWGRVHEIRFEPGAWELDRRVPPYYIERLIGMIVAALKREQAG